MTNPRKPSRIRVFGVLSMSIAPPVSVLLCSIFCARGTWRKRTSVCGFNASRSAMCAKHNRREWIIPVELIDPRWLLLTQRRQCAKQGSRLHSTLFSHSSEFPIVDLGLSSPRKSSSSHPSKRHYPLHHNVLRVHSVWDQVE
jgi:hypothetical protein